MRFDIKISSRELEKKIDRIIRMSPGQVEKAMLQSVIDLAGHIKSMKLSGQVLKARTGSLRRSIGWEVKGYRGKIQGRVGTNLVYARIHEYGGEIKPRQARFLTIPLKAVKTRAGVTRAKARDYHNTFVRKGIIFQNRDGKIVPLFRLSKGVKIPKRPYMAPSLNEKKNDIIRRFGSAIMEIR